MGKAPCCSKVGLHRGPWTPREDSLLINYIQAHGEGQWRSLPRKAGLLRCGKSCRLRWMNYLRPDIKRGNITADEEDLIIRLHTLLGNRWSLIANRLPGRTDNEIKNYWNTRLSKRLHSQGTDPNTHRRLSELHPNPSTKKRRSTSSQGRGEFQVVKPTAHLPKHVRVTALSLTINDSHASFDSNLTGTSTSTSSGSGAAPVQREAQGVPSWPHYDRSMMEQQVNREWSEASDSKKLEKVNEEYLELDHAGDHHLDQDGNQALELDLFAESMLI